jgi:molecular chaperone GrpE
VTQKDCSEQVDISVEGAQAAVTEAAVPAPETAFAPDASLEAALAAAQRKAEEHKNDLLRTLAELDNVRKRAQRDLENAQKFALERFLGELLPVQDSLELGLAAATQASDIQTVREGMELTLKLLTELLQKNGVEFVNPIGEKFNPERHQAMSMQETPGAESGTVMMVLQKGCLLNERLIRPAMVIVAR